MKNEMIWFGIGSLCTLLVGVVVYLIGNHMRHRCKEKDCKCSTTTVYRMIHLHKAKLKNGFELYAIFKFRICRHGHVSVTMKQKTFSSEQIRNKSQDEMEWKSPFIQDLCEGAKIDNPGMDYLFKQHDSTDPQPRIVVADSKSKHQGNSTQGYFSHHHDSDWLHH